MLTLQAWAFPGYITAKETTGLKGITTNDQQAAPVYNIKGQRVNNPTKGIYIQNGKKVVVK